MDYINYYYTIKTIVKLRPYYYKYYKKLYFYIITIIVTIKELQFCNVSGILQVYYWHLAGILLIYIFVISLQCYIAICNIATLQQYYQFSV